jgi:hypothetical protein
MIKEKNPRANFGKINNLIVNQKLFRIKGAPIFFVIVFLAPKVGVYVFFIDFHSINSISTKITQHRLNKYVFKYSRYHMILVK